jgi:hypothetical protein
MNNSEVKLFITTAVSLTGLFGGIIFILQGTSTLFKGIEDSVKYNRYQEALKEYRQCAVKYPDPISVDAYCGDAPSSSMMI